MHQPTAAATSIAGPEYNEISVGNVSKALVWDHESLKSAALEGGTAVEDVKFDEKNIGTDGVEQVNENNSPIKPVAIPYWKSRKCAVWAGILTAGLILASILPAVFLRRSKPFDIDEFASKEIPLYSWEAANRSGTSPQAKALKLISATSPGSYSTFRLKQRYALAVLYYSASSIADGDFNESECQWFWDTDVRVILQDRVPCDNDDRYRSLVLAGGSFNGTIPSEMEMLNDLQYLNFGRSSLHGTIPTHL
jgi:hypothetical protein